MKIVRASVTFMKRGRCQKAIPRVAAAKRSQHSREGSAIQKPVAELTSQQPARESARPMENLQSNVLSSNLLPSPHVVVTPGTCADSAASKRVHQLEPNEPTSDETEQSVECLPLALQPKK